MANPLELTKEICNELKETVATILTKGKGLLAADEILENFGKKLKNVGLDNTEKNRNSYRQLLTGSDPELSKYISAIILDKEFFYEKNENGIRFVDIIKQKGIVPGITVDDGLIEIPFTDNGDVFTQGLDNLHLRCAQYKKDGAKFAKWRVAYKITKTTPTILAIQDNAIILARYAATCQRFGLVPIVEPDVIIDGDHDLERCQKVYEVVLAHVYKELFNNHVFLEGTLLKTAFVTPGIDVLKKSTVNQVAVATIQTLLRTVPAAVPGVLFLSGGLTEEDATTYLNAVKKESQKHITATGNRLKCAWTLTFCYGRALQNTAWKLWQGKAANVKLAQNEILKRAKANSLAINEV